MIDNLSTVERKKFEDYMKRLDEEAKRRYLSYFTIDRNNKVIRERGVELASLMALLQPPL
jgi:hypothetical protein